MVSPEYDIENGNLEGVGIDSDILKHLTVQMDGVPGVDSTCGKGRFIHVARSLAKVKSL